VPGFNEVVFFHRRTRSLILADLALNVGAPGTWAEKFFYSLAGVWGRFGPARAFRASIKDRAALRASLDHILGWDFDRVIVGHGKNIESGGPAALRAAFAFLDEG
jgi:hypothetical protein